MDQEHPTAAAANSTVTAIVSSLGDMVAGSGQVEQGATLKSVAPLLGYVAGHGWTWTGRQAHRVAEAIRRIQQRAAEEGVENLGEAADVLESAIPILGSEACEEKRRMIEEVILNAAKRPAHAARIQALRAIEIIEAMSPAAAVVFGACAHAGTGGRTFRAEIIHGGLLPDLPRFLFLEGLGTLRDSRANSLVASVEDRGANPPTDVLLTARGEWLADWIQSHPVREHED